VHSHRQGLTSSSNRYLYPFQGRSAALGSPQHHDYPLYNLSGHSLFPKLTGLGELGERRDSGLLLQPGCCQAFDQNGCPDFNLLPLRRRALIHPDIPLKNVAQPQAPCRDRPACSLGSVGSWPRKVVRSPSSRLMCHRDEPERYNEVLRDCAVIRSRPREDEESPKQVRRICVVAPPRSSAFTTRGAGLPQPPAGRDNDKNGALTAPMKGDQARTLRACGRGRGPEVALGRFTS